MTLSNAHLVQESFAKVAPVADVAMTTFYERLFEHCPRLKPLFKGDMRSQERKLLEALTGVVDSLDSLHLILPDLEALAQRHVRYGVQEHHYQAAGQALIETLEHHLGDEFTPEVRAAWVSAYTVLSDVMIASSNYKPHQHA
jgi:hemoglobin-like flavoprotein